MQHVDLSKIIQSLKTSYGKDFIDTITMQLHKAIGADYTFVAKIDLANQVSTTLSLADGDTYGENFEYSLQQTPCADVSDGATCIFASGITELFPEDQLLVEMSIQGYVGASLRDSTGAISGILVALYKQPIENADEVASLFELFSGRISAELERWEKEGLLNELNDALEQKIAERTDELSNAIDQLKQTQEKIVEQEKLAALGRLVAGVAHEVNTPLGIAVLGSSTISKLLADINKKFSEDDLSKTAMTRYMAELREASDYVEANLSRASELVSSFKQMATDFHVDDLREEDLVDWLNSLLKSLKPMADRLNISVTETAPDHPVHATIYPSRLAQVITNIFSNAISHAFKGLPEEHLSNIHVSLARRENGIEISISDNGVGMDEQTQHRMLEPFFTTSRATGGMGLGMSIVHNLVYGSLGGAMAVDSRIGDGTSITLTLPGEP